MNILDILNSANSNLLRNKTRTLLNVLAIFVAALTLSLSVGLTSGLKTYLSDLLDSSESPSLLLVSKSDPNGGNPFASLGEIGDYKEDTEKNAFGQLQVKIDEFDQVVKQIPNIVETSPFIRQSVGISYIQLEGTENKYTLSNIEIPNGVSIKLNAGRNSQSKFEIVAPTKLAEKYGMSSNELLGKKLTLAYFDLTKKMNTVEVTIVGVSTPTLFTSNLYMNYDLAKEIADSRVVPNTEKTYSQVYVRLNDYSEKAISETKAKLKDLGYDSQTEKEQAATITSFLDSIQYGLLAFAAISLISASFGIINTMIISVLERTKEIGLSKALGMGSLSVFFTFLVESVFLGLWGALAGVLGAMGIGYLLNDYAAKNLLQGFPGFNLFVYMASDLAMIIGLICLVCLLAGTIPSLRASRLNPIEALRYE